MQGLPPLRAAAPLAAARLHPAAGRVGPVDQRPGRGDVRRQQPPGQPRVGPDRGGGRGLQSARPCTRGNQPTRPQENAQGHRTLRCATVPSRTPPFLGLPLPLNFHCLSLTSSCLFTAFPSTALPLPFHCLSSTSHCPFHRLQVERWILAKYLTAFTSTDGGGGHTLRSGQQELLPRPPSDPTPPTAAVEISIAIAAAGPSPSPTPAEQAPTPPRLVLEAESDGDEPAECATALSF